MKFNHNKKRNTAFIYEILINEISKAALKKKSIKNEQATKLLKEFFNRSMILRKELEIYNSLNTSCVEEKVQFFEKIIVEAKKQYLNLDRKLVFEEQTKIINKINKLSGPDVWTAYIPSFKKLATINQILSQDLPPRRQIIIENKLLQSLIKSTEKKEAFPKINNLAIKTFIEKFNIKYSGKLNENQRQFLNKYILSSDDNDTELKMFLYEEIDRLKHTLEKNIDKRPGDTQKKIKKVLERISGYNKKKLNKSFIFEILQIQLLASELNI